MIGFMAGRAQNFQIGNGVITPVPVAVMDHQNLRYGFVAAPLAYAVFLFKCALSIFSAWRVVSSLREAIASHRTEFSRSYPRRRVPKFIAAPLAFESDVAAPAHSNVVAAAAAIFCRLRVIMAYLELLAALGALELCFLGVKILAQALVRTASKSFAAVRGDVNRFAAMEAIHHAVA
jgi:hypothetical protein